MADTKESRKAKEKGQQSVLMAHGLRQLPAVIVEDYSLDIKDKDGYFGEKASNGAFRNLLASIRSQLQEGEDDPIDAGDDELSRKYLDRLLEKGTPHQAGVIISAVEQFAQNLARVTELLLKVKSWKGVRKIIVGGGFRKSRVGELVIGRADILLRTSGLDVDLLPIRHHPDEAGLIGCAQLAPLWMFEGHDAIIGVDIGGSNFRCGLVVLNRKKAPDLSKAEVVQSELWRHADDKPGRKEATQTLGEMVSGLVAYAEEKKIRLAPFIGMGCPGTVLEDGTLEGGTMNLPGNWGAKNFNLVETMRDMIPKIGDHDTMVLLHNDAVVQGLSEAPFLAEEQRWGVLTIGTGLGNAVFHNRMAQDK